jgi:hypothetical protein
VLRSCTAGDRGYYTAGWSYVDHDQRLVRAGLFYLDGAATTLAISDHAIGYAAPCGACGSGAPAVEMSFAMHRHDTQLVAYVFASSWSGTVAAVVDGVLHKPVLSSNVTHDMIGGHDADDVVLQLGPDRAYWHWTGAWTRIASFAHPALADAEPAGDPATRWLWRELQRDLAEYHLVNFDAVKWAADARYRDETTRALVRIGASPAVVARVKTAATR